MIITDKYTLAQWAQTITKQEYGVETASAIGWVDGSGIRAAVFYNHYNHPAIDAHIISDGSRHWLTRKFLHAMFDYPFGQLGCQRITAPIREGNTEARIFVEKLGFTVEGCLKKYYDTGEARILYGLLREDCKHANQ